MVDRRGRGGRHVRGGHLVEAIARELERSHGFTYIGDEKLRASMSVGMEEEDTYLVEPSDEFRSIVVGGASASSAGASALLSLSARR